MHSTGDLSKNNQYAQVPGTDMITADYVAGKQTTLGRNAASVHAPQWRRPRAVGGRSATPAGMWHRQFMHATIGGLATRGINSFALHALWTDEQQVFFAPPFGPASTFWDAMGDVDAWIGRVSEMARGDVAARRPCCCSRSARPSRPGPPTPSTGSTPTSAARRYALERGQVDFDLVSDGSLLG